MESLILLLILFLGGCAGVTNQPAAQIPAQVTITGSFLDGTANWSTSHNYYLIIDSDSNTVNGQIKTINLGPNRGGQPFSFSITSNVYYIWGYKDINSSLSFDKFDTYCKPVQVNLDSNKDIGIINLGLIK